MSQLLDVLRANEEAICRALGERLKRSDCASLVETAAGDCRAMVAALGGCCQSGDEGPARAWAEAVHKEALRLGVGYGQIMAALRRLEREVRVYVVKTISHKKILLGALRELGDTVDRLRRCHADLQFAGLAAGQQPYEFLGLAEGSRDFICLADLHGKPFYLNPAARGLLGLDEHQPLLSGSLHDYHSDDCWAQLRDVAVPAVNKTGRWEGQSQIRNLKSGELLEMQTTMFLVRDCEGHRPGCLALVQRQAGDRSSLQQALEESEARKHAILESALDPIITINAEGVITEFNRAAEQTFGRPRQEVLGTQPSQVLFPPSKCEGHQNRIDRYLAAGEGSMLGRRAEVTAIRASGEPFPAEMAMTLSQEQGSPVLTFFVRDISQRKQAEEEQARYHAELQRSNRELEQFAYVASHDLQEPLRKIRTFGDRLDAQCGGALDEAGRECLQRMQDAAQRMQKLIDGLLTLSRVTTKGQNFVPVDLAQIAREVVSDLEAQIERTGAEVEVGSLPTIQADPLQMRQLLQNLIGNALKFHRENQPPVVKVHGRFVKPRGDRRAGGASADEQCRIVVEDNGIGFEQKYAERIFGLFQRLHTREIYEGAGVGLAICRKIAEGHGGSISARSTPGSGATFEVLLPLVHASRKK